MTDSVIIELTGLFNGVRNQWHEANKEKSLLLYAFFCFSKKLRRQNQRN